MSSPIEDFFCNPRLVVQLEDSAQIQALKARVAVLESENARLLSLYSRECQISMRAVDLLRLHGINWR